MPAAQTQRGQELHRKYPRKMTPKKILEKDSASYEQRVAAITERTHQICQEIGRLDLQIAIDSSSAAPVRTAHTLKLVRDDSEQAVVLSKEEFLNEFGLFERAAVPTLRAAIEKFRAN